MARSGADIEIEGSGGASLRAYRAAPASGEGPGVVVIQEWWGLVDHIRDVCDRLAREGFVALAPDLYRGDATRDPDEASRLMMDLEIPRARKDLEGAVAALLNDDSVTGAKLGVLGFCMGGQLALAAGCDSPRIGAVVDCYGVHPKVSLALASLEAAVLGVFAENDDFVPAEAVRSLEQQLRDAGKRVHCEIYTGVGHAFLNDSRPDAYDAETASRAWSDILAFLRAELGAG